jgi:hypothetical protein
VPKSKQKIELPSWLDQKSWSDYLEMRRAIGKRMTFRAQELAIMKLAALRNEGEDPTQVLEQSIFSSWQGLFPVKQNGRQQFNGRGPISAKDAFNQTLKNFGITH